MLLEEDPATLIRATVQNFAVTPDKAALKRLQDSTAVLNQARELRLREAESSLKS